MYSNGFVLSVILDTGVHVEADKAGVCKVPFEVEYKVRLRNKNNRRAVATLYIDGENVSEGGFIVNANHFVDIERPVSINKKFKFVSLDSYEASKANKSVNNDGEKGVIEAHFKLEREVKPYSPPYIPWNTPTIPWGSPYPTPFKKYFYNRPSEPTLRSNEYYTSPSPSDLTLSFNSSDAGMISCNASPAPEAKEGCTVQGSLSLQNFVSMSFNFDDKEATILRLTLKGLPLCKCGSHVYNHKFCPECGAKLK